ncbi:TPA: PTS sugar transporter subunit IIA [Enterococcus faecalis]
MRRFYIASHGDFSKGIKHSLEMIAGHSAAAVHTYSLYPGESAVDFFGELKKKAEQAPEDEFILMGDLFGASVVTAMMGLTVGGLYFEVQRVSNSSLHFKVFFMWR